MRKLDRRTLLRAAGASAAVVLAGCQGGSQPPETETTATEETTVTTTETATSAETTTRSGATPAELERRAREFVDLLDEGAYEDAHGRFGETMASQFGVDRLERLWTALEDQLGSFLSLSNVETGRQDGHDVVTGLLNFEDGQRKLVLSFDGDAITGLWFRQPSASWTAPEYVDESSFTERSVSLRATDTCSLGGTLTIPRGVDRAPGVVLVHGQGPSDRDGTIGPNKPYRDLAWGLASRGVAVLRYDKRTQACDVNLAEITIDEAVTEDALAAVERLRETSTVADDDVVVAGHSIGGTLAPRVAARDGNLAGIVMLAALVRSAPDAIVAQNEYIARRDGNVTDAEEEQLKQVRRVAEQIRTQDFPDDEVVYIGGDEYWGTLEEYDPIATAKEVEAPRLFLQGERDYQVTVEDDLSQWRRALGDESNVTFRQYSKLNHLFMPGTGKPGNREYLEQNHVAKAVVTDVAAFAKRVTGDGGTTVGDATTAGG